MPHLVVIDHYRSATAERAELVLPAATFAEGDGTLVSSEGRAQRYFQVFPPRPAVGESWRWLGESAGRAGLRAAGPWPDIASVASALALEHRALARAGEMAAADEESPSGRPLPRQPHRYSGRTAILANRTVHEPAPPTDPDSPFVFSMEGQPLTSAPGRLLPFYWWPRWNSVQSLNKFQEEVGGPLRGGEPGVRLLEPGDCRAAAGGDGEGRRRRRVPRRAVLRSASGASSPRRRSSAPKSCRCDRAAVAERASAPFVYLGAEDAEKLALERRRHRRGVGRAARRCGCRSMVEPALPAGHGGAADRAARSALPGAARDRRGEEAVSETVRALLNVFGVLIGVLSLAGLLVWVERRLLALVQERYGPNRVGPFGLLQTVADTIKLFCKEDWVPPFADRFLFVLAPAIDRGDRRCSAFADHSGRARHRRRRPRRRAAVLPRGVVDGRLQRGARRLGVEQQVLAARRRCARRRRWSATRSSWASR